MLARWFRAARSVVQAVRGMRRGQLVHSRLPLTDMQAVAASMGFQKATLDEHVSRALGGAVPCDSIDGVIAQLEACRASIIIAMTAATRARGERQSL